jgi:hypothetical protein
MLLYPQPWWRRLLEWLFPGLAKERKTRERREMSDRLARHTQDAWRHRK